MLWLILKDFEAIVDTVAIAILFLVLLILFVDMKEWWDQRSEKKHG